MRMPAGRLAGALRASRAARRACARARRRRRRSGRRRRRGGGGERRGPPRRASTIRARFEAQRQQREPPRALRPRRGVASPPARVLNPAASAQRKQQAAMEIAIEAPGSARDATTPSDASGPFADAERCSARAAPEPAPAPEPEPEPAVVSEWESDDTRPRRAGGPRGVAGPDLADTRAGARAEAAARGAARRRVERQPGGGEGFARERSSRASASHGVDSVMARWRVRRAGCCPPSATPCLRTRPGGLAVHAAQAARARAAGKDGGVSRVPLFLFSSDVPTSLRREGRHEHHSVAVRLTRRRAARCATVHDSTPLK